MVPGRTDPLEAAAGLLAVGRILAIKGLGGFHLAVDAANETAVSLLRQRKNRPDKPFALMMPDLETVARHCYLNRAERETLTSRPRPIIILEKRTDSSIVPEVAPRQSTLGVMLPYTPLHYLLLEVEQGIPTALVMTSGNLSEEPIATGNDEARQRLGKLADAFLMHDRDIHTRCDDSVLRMIPRVNADENPAASKSPSQNYPLRRARGYAPNPLQFLWEMPPLLATGAELKNTFCLARDRYAAKLVAGSRGLYRGLHEFGPIRNRF